MRPICLKYDDDNMSYCYLESIVTIESSVRKSERNLCGLFFAFIILFFLCFGAKAWGQTATIGDGTNTNYYPMPGFWGYQYDVYLYTPSAASFLNSACTISSIAYNISSGSTNSAQMTIWVKDVDLITLSTSSTFSDFTSGATQVYSGSRTTSTGWNTYSFSSSFSHQAGKTLLVAVKGIGCTNSGGCSRNCYYTSASSTHWYKHADSSDPGTSVTGSVDGNRSNVQITYLSDCTPSFGSNTDCITNFTLGSINNSTASSSTNGYGNYTSQSTNLAQGSTITASLTSGAGSGTHAAAVWIDFNNNGIFESSERVGTQGSIGASITANISLSIPSNAALGSHRLRVVYQWNVSATDISPCASATYGEAEDYTVNIIGGGPTHTTMTCGTTYSGTLGTSGSWGSGTSSTYSMNSGWGVGGEACYAYTPAESGSYTITTTTTSGDPDFWVLNEYNPQTAIYAWGSGNQTVSLVGGHTYYIVADNYSSSNNAGYTISVSCPVATYTIAVSANPSAGGTVSGGGTYSSGASCTVSATTNTCYTFSGWYESGSRVSTSASYTFTVSGNRTLEARYTQDTYTISVSANPSNGGSVSGGGTFNCGTSPTITATPNSGYNFVNWTEGGSQVSTSASYTISNISANHTLVANFEEISSGGEDCPIIGEGTGTTYYGPYNSLWGYSFVEQIYPASEIGQSGAITSIAFNMSSTDEQTNNIVVYMKHTNKSSFDSNTLDFVPVTASDIVYSGSFTFNRGWNAITLNTPFVYNGTDNIVIGIHENTSGYSTRYFYYTEATGALISAHSDSYDPDPYNLSSYSGTKYVQNYRLNTKICISSSSSSPITICEDFEGYTGTAYNIAGPIPTGWDVIYTGEDEYSGGSPHVATSIYGSRVISTGNGLSFTADNDDYYDGYAVLPNIGVPISVSFKYRFEGNYGTLTVGYITNLNDVSTYHVLETVPRSTTQGTPKEYTFAAGSIPVGARLAFKYTCPETYTVWTCGIDDVCVTYIPVSCGAIVYYDDFGGNDIQDERYAGPHKLAELGYTSGGGIVPATWTYAGDYTRCNYLAGYEYTYSQDFGDCRHHGNSSCMSNYPNVYAINKNTYHDASSNGWSVNKSDYSFGDDVNRGYMFQGDGTGDFYVKTINNVPAGSYTLSAWFMEVSSGVKYRLSVSGATTASSGIQNVSGAQGEWVRKSINFTLNSSGNITISIYGDGDFAADEILLATTENAPPAASLSFDHICSDYPMVSYLASAYGPGEYGTFSYTTHNANGCEYTVERDATWGYFHIYYDYTLNCNGDNTYYVQDVPMWDCSAATIREASSCSGKRFVKWATRANGSGTSYQPGDQISLTTNIYLYAIYEDSDPCDNITAMICGQTYSGTLGLVGVWDDYPSSDCDWENDGEEKVYSFTPQRTGNHLFSGTTIGNGDVDFRLLDMCDINNANVIICWDENSSSSANERTAYLTVGTTYFLAVDNYYSNNDSEYEISVTCPSPCDDVTSMTCGQTYSGSLGTVGVWSSAYGSSWSCAGEEVVYSFTPSVTGNYTISCSDVSGDPDYFLMESCGNDGNCIEYLVSGSRTVSLTSGTTYYLVVDNYSSTNNASYNVSISLSSIPAISASESLVCKNTAVTLTAPAGGSSYEWSVSGSGNSITPTVTTNTTYNVTVWSGNSCSASNSVQVNVYENLTSSAIAGADNYCLNATATTLSITPSGGSGAGTYNYQWQYSVNGSTWNNTGSNNNSVTPQTNSVGTTYYRVVVSDNCESITLTSVQITVHDKPTVPAITSPDAICVGEALALPTLTIINNGSAVSSEGWEISPSQNGTYTPFTNSNLQQDLDGYYIRYTATNGCGSSSNTGVPITINHPNISITSTYDYVWRGGTSNWNIPSNWYEYNNGTYSVASELPSEAKNYYIAIRGSGTCLQDVQQAYMNSDATVNTIEIAPGAEVHILENVTLRLSGSIINNGIFVAANSSTIELNGADNQILTSAMEFGNVTFAQTANGKKIIAPHGITVNGLASFTNGCVSGPMTFASGANSEGANLACHVDGQVTKYGNGAFTFPTGNNGVLGTLSATIDNNTNEGVKVRFNNESADGHGFSTDAPDNYPRWWNINDMCSGDGANRFDHVNNYEYWKLDGITGTTSLSGITLKLDATTANAHFHDGATSNGVNANINAAAHYDCWKNMGGSANIENGGKTITVSGITETLRATRGSFDGIVTIGSKSEVIVLPIELETFTATCDGKSALVEWSTATERNNDYFILERSDNAIEFYEVARVAGAGNSIAPLDYSYTDYGVHGGDNYYRLVQVDYDGTHTISEIVVANCVEMVSGDPDVLAYPNPFYDDITVVLDNFDNRPARIEVYDVLGKLIMYKKIDSPQNSYEMMLHLGNLPPATYNIRVSTADFVINRKVVKQ